MRILSVIFSSIFCIGTNAQIGDQLVPPRLVVGVVVDQMRADMVARYWNGFGPDGFKRLVRNGAWMLDAQVPYVPSDTGPGHASIYSGTSPSQHGIAGNDWFMRDLGEMVNCVLDENERLVGPQDGGAGRSPHYLLASTLADELERATSGRSKTMSLSMKDRGAILPIGRTGDAAYWYDERTGHWTTSSWYMQRLPNWLGQHNNNDLANDYLKRTWSLLLDEDAYAKELPDDNPYEVPIGNSPIAALPLDLATLSKEMGPGLLRYTPFGNTLTVDMAIDMIRGERLGEDEFTDLLAISFSATDDIGHETGPLSIEVEDAFYRLDRDIARLLKVLDLLVGENRYFLFLTSDHGVVDVPAYQRDRKLHAGYVDLSMIRSNIENELTARFGEGKWVRVIMNEQLYLDHRTVQQHKADLEEVAQVARAVMLREPNIAEVLTTGMIMDSEYTTGIRGAMQKGHARGRSGDLMFAYRPGFIGHHSTKTERGTDHGSPNRYDTHVPLIFYGNSTPVIQVSRRVTLEDIAPTVAFWSGFALPNACQGEAILELFIR